MTHNQDLTGKTMVITGATAGIGQAALRALALRGATIIGVGRSNARAEQTMQAIHSEGPTVKVDFAIADLSSQRQVRQLAGDIADIVNASGGGKIDVLVNNAGAVSSWYTATEDGYELQFAVNHLAPYLLTHELLPLLHNAPAARVITTSSSSHYGTKMRWADVMYRTGYSNLLAYKQSKLANVLFSAEFNRRLATKSGIRAFAADPGLVTTSIGLKGTSGIEKWVWNLRMSRGVSPEEGAATIVHLASEPSVQNSPAVYWKDCQPKAPSRYAQLRETAARLWNLSERLCGVAWA